MTARRYAVAGLAHARSSWFGDVGRWSTTALVPVDFVKCLRVEELRALVDGGHPLSAALLDSGVPGLDRDLVADLQRAGVAVLVVSAASGPPPPVGADFVLGSEFSPAELTAALEEHAVPFPRPAGAPTLAPPTGTPEPAAGGFRGRLVMCCGPGGTGASIMAAALAQGLAADPRRRGMVALADLALDADQALLHDAVEPGPGVLELVDAHRSGDLHPEEVRTLLHAVADRGYDLLLGLRRHRDWTALRPRAVAAALDGLLGSYSVVVADADADLEGEAQTGSLDVEERNTLARATADRADLVMVVGVAGTKGLYALGRCIRSLLDHGVPPERLLTVVNRSSRSPAARAGVAAALASLVPAGLAAPIHVPDHPRVEHSVLEGRALPHRMASRLTGPVLALLRELPVREASRSAPEPVAPGSLGHWRATA